MRILFCGDTFPAASTYLKRRLGLHDEIVICPGGSISKALDGVDILIPLMCSVDAATMHAGHFRLIQRGVPALKALTSLQHSSVALWSQTYRQRVATPIQLPNT